MTDDCREAFEKKFKTLDLTKTRDAWDRTIYAHSHVQAMFDGYEAAWNTRTPPAGDDEEQKAWDLFAAAALTGNLAAETKDYEFSSRQKLIEVACETADAMMEQRKARMK